MNLKLFKQLLLRMHKRQPPILSLSGPGLGKSSVHRQVCEELTILTGKRWEYFSLVLSNYDSFDIPGFMVPQRTPDNRFVSLMTEPFFWDRIAHWNGVDTFGILHLDEVMDCGEPMQKLAAQMIFDRRVGLRFLPPGCWPLLSGNRRKDRSGVQRMTSMFQNRVRAIELDWNADVWLEHERHLGEMHPLGLAYVASHPTIIYNDAVPADPGPFCSPRSFSEGVRDLAHLGVEIGTPEHLLPGILATTDDGLSARRLLQGSIGEGVTTDFFSWLKYADEIPTVDEIVVDPAKAKLPDNPGGQLMVAYMIGERAKDAHLTSVINYLFRMKVEFQIVTMRALFERANRRKELPTLSSTPRVLEWVNKHENVLRMTV